MNQFGLIGYPLSHSFSKKYFTDKFEKEGISKCQYDLFPLENLDDFPKLLLKTPFLVGLNVTIPYKEQIFKYLTEIDEAAQSVGAVNTIKITDSKLKGYNTDIYGFEKSLKNFLGDKKQGEALILGTGGAAKAVAYILNKMEIIFKYVSRRPQEGNLQYEDLNKNIIENHFLIINTTPLGMAPNLDTCPPIPYSYLNASHFLYDLVYNPEKTLFLNRGAEIGAQTKNGLEMLYLQAEKAWEIWQNE